MRQALKDSITKTIMFKYELPNLVNTFNKSKFSTDCDSCYSVSSNDELADIIYNAVIEYAFDEYRIKETDLETLHSTALLKKLKFNKYAAEEQKIKYGFYGEILLYCMLHIFYKASPIISRGHFYNILENSETKGYDAYHLIDNNGQIELWFGEVKFYKSFTAATTGKNGAITNLSKAISDDYLNTNLIMISERLNDIAASSLKLKSILNNLRANPEITITELTNKYKIKLIYPIFILFNEKNKGYDAAIRNAINHLEKQENILFNISIDISLFFILTPVNDVKNIKTRVIEWIRDKKQLMS